MPLESHHERLMLVLRAPKTQKVLFSYRKTTLFANAVFRYFEALEILLGNIFALLGPFRPQNGPRNGPQKDPQIRLKTVQQLVNF